jgi:hypothetical protein
MTACVSLALGAILDVTFLTIIKGLIRQAPSAVNVFPTQVFSSCEFSLVNPYQAFFEFLVAILCGFENGANPAIQAAWRKIIRIDLHFPSSCLSKF